MTFSEFFTEAPPSGKEIRETWWVGPSAIEASTAPAILARLESGRIFMAWNRYYYHGTKEFRPYGGDFQRTATPTSNNRHELS
ncbi:MAG: hypothetical protein ACC661_07680, partial [Verrucomicrobiales bacterium]